MTKLIGKEKMCFRYGGEEFVIILKAKGTKDSYELAEKLRTHIENTVSPSGETITISLGVTAFKPGDSHIKDLVNRADAALYHSKQTGRNKTSVCLDNNLKISS